MGEEAGELFGAADEDAELEELPARTTAPSSTRPKTAPCSLWPSYPRRLVAKPKVRPPAPAKQRPQQQSWNNNANWNWNKKKRGRHGRGSGSWGQSSWGQGGGSGNWGHQGKGGSGDWGQGRAALEDAASAEPPSWEEFWNRGQKQAAGQETQEEALKDGGGLSKVERNNALKQLVEAPHARHQGTQPAASSVARCASWVMWAGALGLARGTHRSSFCKALTRDAMIQYQYNIHYSIQDMPPESPARGGGGTLPAARSGRRARRRSGGALPAARSGRAQRRSGGVPAASSGSRW